jgi:Flp pilus assembly protein TadD
MSQQPISFCVPEVSFDLTLLPEAARRTGSTAFREAVTTYYKDAYREAGGRVDVAFSEGQIEVSWDPASDQRPASETITEHLRAGRYEEAIPLLETTLRLEPNDLNSLTNPGMVYSDLGRLEEARQLLERAVELHPTDANAHVALGVAALRAKDPVGARGPLERAVTLAPSNPHARHTLGQLLLMEGDPAAALPHLRQAAIHAPGNPTMLFTLAQCLMGLHAPEHFKEAESLLNRALALAPQGDLAERIKQTNSRLARQVLRTNAAGQPRMDVAMYCASALETYGSLTPTDQKQLLMEVATAGQKGLKINDPDARLQLRHLPNSKPVSALHAACLLFVGVKLLMPGEDTGFDFEREFEVARGVVGSGR